MNILTYNFLPLNRMVKANRLMTFFRKSFLGFFSALSHIRYQRKVARPICVFSTPENYKQGRSDSFLPSLAESCRSHQVLSPRNYLASSEGCEVRHRFTSPRIKKEICRPFASATHLLFDAKGYPIV